MTVEDKNCLHCNNHYVTGDDVTVEDNELCPSCDNQGMLLDCPLCDMLYYESNHANSSCCPVCYMRNKENITKPDVLLVIGQGHILLDAFGERTECLYSSKTDVRLALNGLHELIMDSDAIHIDVIIDTSNPIGGLRQYYLETEVEKNRFYMNLYNFLITFYEQL